MFFENGNVPVSGGLLLAGTAYALISLMVTGPLVGDRMIEKMDWAGQCAAHIRAGVEAEQPETAIVPKLSCNTLFGTFGPDGKAFCQIHGRAIENNPLTELLDAPARAERELQKRRTDYAVSRADLRCECAVTTTLANRRVPLTIYAGSARLIVPPSVKMLDSDLRASLNSAACAMKG